MAKYTTMLVAGISILFFIAGAALAYGFTSGDHRTDAEIIIDATREAEASQKNDAKATAEAEDEAEDAFAREIIEDYCEALKKRFKTDRQLPSIYARQLASGDNWLLDNAHPNSEITLIAEAFLLDTQRVMSGNYVSWASAFQLSGSKYIGDCATADWKR